MGQSTRVGPAIPVEAESRGGINATVDQSVRTQKSIKELSPGPIRGEKENFLPAAYEIVHYIPLPNGEEKVFPMIREDH